MVNKKNSNTDILEYRINDIITLKLEKGRTNIYINGEEILYCKYLLLNIPIEKIEQFDHIESIDQASELLDHSLDPYKQPSREVSIPPEVEFWGHCSNVQAWVENDYDMRIIDSDIGFSLLRKMKEVGYPSIDKIYKEEMIKRFKSGWLPTIEYLLNGNYLLDFTEEEREVLFQEIKKTVINMLMEIDLEKGKDSNVKKNREIEMIMHNGYIYFLDDEDKRKIPFVRSLREKCLEILENQREFRSYHEVVTSRLEGVPNKDKAYFERGYAEEYYGRGNHSLEEIVNIIVLTGYFGALTAEDVKNHPKLQQLEKLELTTFNSIYTLKVFPENIVHLRALKHLKVNRYDLMDIPDSLSKLTNLVSLDLSENKLTYLPDSIGNLRNLEILNLYDNKLESLPISIKKLTKLKDLRLSVNNFKNFPMQIIFLNELQKLSLINNKLEILPEEISKLSSLESLEVSNNQLLRIPNSIGELKNLKHLNLFQNELSKFPEQICNLEKLQTLDLGLNAIPSIPDCVKNLKHLNLKWDSS